LSVILILAAILPAIVILVWISKSDLFPEPRRLVWGTAGLGIIGVVPIFLFGWPLDELVSRWTDPVASALGEAFLVTAIPEELVKFGIILLVSQSRHFDDPMDGIVYGVAASMGFAGLENILYVTEHGMATAIMRAVTAVPSHAMDGLLMGYFLALSKFAGRNRRRFLVSSLVIPILFHGVYDSVFFLADALKLDGISGLIWTVVFLEFQLSHAIFTIASEHQSGLLFKKEEDREAGWRLAETASSAQAGAPSASEAVRTAQREARARRWERHGYSEKENRLLNWFIGLNELQEIEPQRD
jgi:RsiW-degrading membrane proteinase PrsW (M82 family)